MAVEEISIIFSPLLTLYIFHQCYRSTFGKAVFNAYESELYTFLCVKIVSDWCSMETEGGSKKFVLHEHLFLLHYPTERYGRVLF